MAYTINTTTLIQGQREHVVCVTIEVALAHTGTISEVVFDSAAVYAAVGLTDTKNAKVERVQWMISNAIAAKGCFLVWADSTVLPTAVNAPTVLSLPSSITYTPFEFDFSSFGGLPNFVTPANTSGNLILVMLPQATSISISRFNLILTMRLS